MGGLARRAGFVDSVRAAHENVVLVDAGGFAGTQDDTGESRSLYLIEMMRSHFRYDAITIGASEIVKLDRDVLVSLVSEAESLFVSANFYDRRAGRLLMPEYRIVRRGDIRIGVTAVSLPGGWKDRVEQEEFEMLDPMDVLPGVLQVLRRKADVTVLLARMSLVEARALGGKLFGLVDATVVGSGEQGRGMVFPESGGSVYLTGGSRGQSLGVTKIALESGRVAGITGDEAVLTREYPEDEATLELVQDFLRTLNALMRDQALQQKREELPEDGQYYLAAHNCAACHKREYDIWLETPHSDAFRTLSDIGMDALPECYSCHVTGHGDPAGYHPSDDKSFELVNVQCEVCHDKGSAHARDGSYGQDLLMNSCVRCHDAGNSPLWDPEVYWRMIEH